MTKRTADLKHRSGLDARSSSGSTQRSGTRARKAGWLALVGLLVLLVHAPHSLSETPTQPRHDEWPIFGQHPFGWILSERTLTQVLAGRPDSIPQLLLNIHTTLEYDLLLQPNFFAAGPMQKVLGVAPMHWSERVKHVAGKTIHVRDATITVPNGVTALTAVIHEEITTPRGKTVVTQPESGIAPPDQNISGSITVQLTSGTRICVCDVRDWMGGETRSELVERLRADAADHNKGALIYDFSPADSQSLTFSHKSARFMVRGDDDVDQREREPAPAIHGRDWITGFTIAEENR